MRWIGFHLCFTCANCCDHRTVIVFRMTWLFTNHTILHNVMIVVDGRGEDMATELWLPVHLQPLFIALSNNWPKIITLPWHNFQWEINHNNYVFCCIDIMNACLIIICSDCTSNNWLLLLPLSMPWNKFSILKKCTFF